ncbi:hypothetical protein AB4Y40_25040 [Paraburkholderia sp. EG287B]|uniref:hypothetical protein n=1 Tax=unclassified Paraburkholderia TaxID=2615204 RepID=UPI0034D30FD5
MSTPEAGAAAAAIDETRDDLPVPRPRRPWHPYVVLAAAVLLPGAGQVLNRMPTRALTMVFFMLSLGFLTLQLAAPERSFVGRHAGGIFVYAIAVLDAYGTARYRWEAFNRTHRAARA